MLRQIGQKTNQGLSTCCLLSRHTQSHVLSSSAMLSIRPSHQSYARPAPKKKSKKIKTKRPWVYKMEENEHMSYIYDIRNRFVQEPTNIPEPAQYTGSCDVNVAYVLSRLPITTPDKHPVLQMEERQSMKERNREARHSYADFWSYVEAWEALFRARNKGSGKKKKRKKVDRKAKVGRTRPKKERVSGKLDSWTKNKLLGRSKMDESVLHFWNTFQPQMRYTQADFDDDRSTMQRKLSDHLYLIVYDARLNAWKFPERKLGEHETLAFAAQKQFHKDMGDDLFAFFDSNAPIGHVENASTQIVVPEADKKEKRKSSTFFMWCEYMTGELSESWKKQYPKHAWVSKNELQDYKFPTAEYLERAQKMLK